MPERELSFTIDRLVAQESSRQSISPSPTEDLQTSFRLLAEGRSPMYALTDILKSTADSGLPTTQIQELIDKRAARGYGYDYDFAPMEHLELVETYAAIGDIPTAQRTLSVIPETTHRTKTFLVLAKAIDQVSQDPARTQEILDHALSLAGRIPTNLDGSEFAINPDHQVKDITDIAYTAYSMGLPFTQYLSQADEIAETIGHYQAFKPYDYVAQAHAQCGDFEGAEYWAERISGIMDPNVTYLEPPDYSRSRAETLYGVAQKRIAKGDIEEAQDLARKSGDQEIIAHTAADIAVYLTGSGQYATPYIEEAMKHLSDVRGIKNRELALAKLNSRLGRAVGLTGQDATPFFLTALRNIDGFDYARRDGAVGLRFKAKDFMEIAQDMHAGGYDATPVFNHALEIVAGTDNRELASYDVISTQINLGYLEQAQRQLQQELNGDDYVMSENLAILFAKLAYAKTKLAKSFEDIALFLTTQDTIRFSKDKTNIWKEVV